MCVRRGSNQQEPKRFAAFRLAIGIALALNQATPTAQGLSSWARCVPARGAQGEEAGSTQRLSGWNDAISTVVRDREGSRQAPGQLRKDSEVIKLSNLAVVLKNP
jgi:hypothetical protein